MAYDTDRRARLGAGTWTQAEAAQVDVGLRQYMLKVYNYMGSGLLLSGIVAMLIANNPSIGGLFYSVGEAGRMGYTALGWVSVIGTLGLIFMMNGNRAIGTLQAMYWAFVALMGVSLASTLMIYTGASVARVFLITAATYGALSLYGYTTKKDLSGMGTFLFMGLIGLVIASLVNIFIASTMMHFVISVIGVIVFAGLTAYDTQRIKNSYFEVSGSGVAEHAAVLGAVSLYLNFINLFQFMMSFFGQRE
jgi:FtsH-binding integral membrane protein